VQPTIKYFKGLVVTIMYDKWIIDKTECILITGANGFVGSKVVETLLQYGFTNLRCLLRSDKNISKLKHICGAAFARVEFISGNLLSRDDCQRAAENVSIIYHLAAGTEKSFAGCFLNSVVTTRNLLEAAKQVTQLKRFVNIGSIAVYTNKQIPWNGFLDESCEVDTEFVDRFEPYAYGKAKQDAIVRKYAMQHSMPYVIVRPSVVFGPGKAKITDRIGTDTFGIFLHLGLSNMIPLTYIDNCAEAIVLAGLKKGVDGHVFNIVDDDLPKSREFLRLYKRFVRRLLSIPVPYPIWFTFCYLWEKYSIWSGGQLPPVFNRRSCSVYWKRIRYSNRKAKQMLGWQPHVHMKEALEKYFIYMRQERGQGR
jgi:nucleoside-diphosphate-sugar epimerase